MRISWKWPFMALLGLSGIANAATLNLELNGFEPMKGQHYEGWNIVGGKALSTGRFSMGKDGRVFNVDESGAVLSQAGADGVANFKIDGSQLKSSVFVLTIEPNNDEDPGPSPVHIIGGTYKNGQTDLSIGHSSSLGTPLDQVSGSYILAAPTGGTPNQGLWFVDPSTGKGSLQLEALPSAWVYEGWLVNTKNGKKFSTGIFRNAEGADADGAGFLAGPLKLSFPPVPGQDIVRSPVVLDDGIHAAVISVEPYPDFDPAPYAIKVLKADIESGAPGMTAMPLKTISEQSAPSGKATLKMNK